MTNETFEQLVAKSKREMTEAERNRQRISFAYGNTHAGNECITREMAEKAAEAINSEK